jgi:ABC-type sugar transport system ATPase subunit
MMIGRSLEHYFPQHLGAKPGETVLSVRNLSSLGKFANVSFDLRAGEILGFAGSSAPGAARSPRRSSDSTSRPRPRRSRSAGR